MTKRLWVIALVAGVVAMPLFAQFKTEGRGEPRVADGLIHEESSAGLFGWFNPDRFHMRHSLGFSYQTIGDQGLSMGTYTNSMMYEFDDNLRARADLSLSYSPYSTMSRQGKNDLSSIYLSRAEIDYRPWENFHMQVQYRSVPYGTLSPWYNPWFREDGF